jgi:hypothetical protein
MALTNQSRNSWRILSIMRFVAFFVKASVRGGLDGIFRTNPRTTTTLQTMLAVNSIHLVF